MTADPLELLRASNPVPHGSAAPPIERVLERISAEPSARRPWRAWTGVLVPALGAAAAIAVVVAALLAARVDRRGSVRHDMPAVSSVFSAPSGGMRGLVFLFAAGFLSPSEGLISLQQCLGYQNGDPTPHTSCRDWTATTTDSGASWQFTRRHEYVFHPRFSGADGWAEGLTGGGVARFFVTHDNGRSWSVASSAAPALGNQNVSVGGSEVWATGSHCSGPGNCTVTILHGPVTGGRLMATSSQPIAGDWANVEVVAAGPERAYVVNPDHVQQTFVTHDDGRSWKAIESPCPTTAFEFTRLAGGGSADAVWATCQPWRGATTLRRLDGERGWLALPAHFRNVFRLEPVSARIAWGVTPGGAVVRTTDGGFTWSTVWSATRSQSPALNSRPPKLVAAAADTPMLTVQGASSASVAMILTRGVLSGQARFTNLVVYRTTDGGRTWTPTVVPLPRQ